MKTLVRHIILSRHDMGVKVILQSEDFAQENILIMDNINETIDFIRHLILVTPTIKDLVIDNILAAYKITGHVTIDIEERKIVVLSDVVNAYVAYDPDAASGDLGLYWCSK